ncbi:hypothetical protein GCM10020367_60130 [Streptomyces sannanensis]|uniref:Uncharacterized protein n=1 Tax=Streptomyces sannanensis TaxID=285536 RepID=A0ABP6SK09_9ACTN
MARLGARGGRNTREWVPSPNGDGRLAGIDAATVSTPAATGTTVVDTGRRTEGIEELGG